MQMPLQMLLLLRLLRPQLLTERLLLQLCLVLPDVAAFAAGRAAAAVSAEADVAAVAVATAGCAHGRQGTAGNNAGVVGESGCKGAGQACVGGVQVCSTADLRHLSGSPSVRG
jgi:hypothetical protein